MADIDNKVNQIRQATLGKDIRETIAAGIESINEEVKSTTQKQEILEEEFDQMIINAGSSNAEIVQARVKADGTAYEKLQDRLNGVDSALAERMNPLFGLKSVEGQMFDSFAKADTILNGSKTLSGHTWSVSGPGQNIAKIKDGALVGEGQNFYASLNYGKVIPYIQGSFSFSPVTGTDSTSENFALIMQGAPFDLGTMIHLTCNNGYLDLTKRLNSGGFIQIRSYPVTGLKTDGTIYSVSMELKGNKLTLTDPFGKKEEFIDNDFLTINPTVGTWQMYPITNTKYQGKIHNVAMGEKAYNYSNAVNGVASKSEIAWLTGEDLTFKQRISDKTISTSGWYTIATQASYITYLCAGTINISANDTIGRVALAKIKINALCNTTPSIEIEYASLRLGGSVTQVRVSTDATNVKVEIYVPDANTYPVSLTLEYEGLFEVQTPTLSTGTLTNVKTVAISPSQIERTVVLTQAEYDVLPSTKTSDNCLYLIKG